MHYFYHLIFKNNNRKFARAQNVGVRWCPLIEFDFWESHLVQHPHFTEERIETQEN